MDLKSGDLFWPRISARPAARFSPVPQHLRCDVAIVGAGLSGTMIAQTLATEGCEVVVLDKRAAGQGSTSASTALVLYEVDTPLSKLAARRGTRAAFRSYRRCSEAIDELEVIIEKLGVDVGFHRRPSLYLASRRSHVPQLWKEFQIRRRAGFQVEFLDQKQIARRFSFSAPGAIWSPHAAEVNPLQLTWSLMENARRLGTRFFHHTQVIKVTEERGGAVVHVANGHRITARWVVMAAGFETSLPAVKRIVRLKSSYALVTRPVAAFPGWPQRCLVWETQRPYFYLRTTSDNRIMIGGEDEDFVDATKRDRLIRKKSGVLMNKLKEMFPEIPLQVAHRWAGTFGETKDGLPYIGAFKPGSRILYALCYGANGTNFAVIAAALIRDQVASRPHADAKLFGFDR